MLSDQVKNLDWRARRASREGKVADLELRQVRGKLRALIGRWKTMIPANIKMKALVVSRLMMGDITNWTAFERERDTASQIADYLAGEVRPGDMVLVMSNGSFDGLCRKLLGKLQERGAPAGKFKA